jgi:hypothetical protein
VFALEASARSARSLPSANKAAVFIAARFSRTGRDPELIYADAIRLRAALDFGFDRAWPLKQTITLPILIIYEASAGVSTSMPNHNGPKSVSYTRNNLP